MTMGKESWQTLVKQLKKDKQQMLESLASPMAEGTTARLRGKIEMVDEILNCYPELLKTDPDEAAD